MHIRGQANANAPVQKKSEGTSSLLKAEKQYCNTSKDDLWAVKGFEGTAFSASKI